jgi:hypothetical protein
MNIHLASCATVLLTGLLLFGGQPDAFAAKKNKKTTTPTTQGVVQNELSTEISAVNALSTKTGQVKQTFLKSLAQEAGITLQQLSQQDKGTSLGYGDLLVANVIAQSASLPFDQINTAHHSQSWTDLSLLHNVKLTDLVNKLKTVQKDVAKEEKSIEDKQQKERQAALKAQQEADRRRLEEQRKNQDSKHRKQRKKS